ncbi:glycosyltransferase family 2 protein [Paraclostridium bifermentans]|nr:glycosyltransferase family 2 protein [Paraclostridium bifermentans]
MGYLKKCSFKCRGYDTDTVGEDMDLVVKLHSFYRKNKIKYKIKYEYKAICWSQVPEKLKDLKGQRRRWHIGLITSLNSHRYIFFKS